MIASLLFAALALTSPIPAAIQPPSCFQAKDKEEETGPDAATIKATLKTLKESFAKGTEIPERLDAISAAASVPCNEVAKALGQGLKDKELEIVNSTLMVLAKMEAPEALKQLVSFRKKDRRLKKEEELLANTLKAIAWKGSPTTIKLLSEDIFTNAGKGVIKARILGLGRIRTTESVEALIGIMKSASRNKIQPFMDDLSLSLAVLTGSDEGKSQDRWIRWWNDHKRSLEVPETMPRLTKLNQKAWDHYWGIKAEKKRGGKREDRGGD